MKFRYDINGLRSLAVLAVVLFHFKPEWLPGGFAGVDVFFVISGFLMTSIIFKGIENNNFNLVKFYTARANRIIPVLGAAAFVLIIFGWFYLIPSDFRELGRQIEKSSLFYSNTYFANGAGYFETSDITKWLLHTWSLSVEWQFYIFFPLIIFLLRKYFNYINIKAFILFVFLVSFIFSIYMTQKDGISSYFMLSTRVWEMLLGGLAVLYPWKIEKRSYQYSMQIIGLVMILISYILFSKETVWPGYWALVPTLGTYLIILSCLQNNILLSNLIFQAIGKWSYSIYVWHWPLVVFGFYFMLKDWYLYGIPLSIVLGFISYKFIEQRKLLTYNYWKDLYKSKPIHIALVLVLLSTYIKKTNGVESHYSEDLLNLTNEISNSNPYQCDSIKGSKESTYECVIGQSKNIKAIVVGDSHADALTTAVSNKLNFENEGVVSIVRSGCPLIKGFNLHSDDDDICLSYNENRLKALQSTAYKGVPVIFIGRLVSYIDGENDPERADKYVNKPNVYFGAKKVMTHDQAYTALSLHLKDTMCTVSKYHPTYIVQPIPEFEYSIPKILARDILLNRKTDISLTKQDYLNRSARMREIINLQAQFCGVAVLDPMPILCPDNNCLYEYKGRSIYRDGDHLSEYGNKLLVPLFDQVY
ncbi:MAG: acyltransferase family protein [Bacteroidales bacterium]